MTNPGRHGGGRLVLAKLGLSVFTLLVALVIVEHGLRAIGYEYRPMSVESGAAGDSRYFHLFGDQHFVYDTDLIWRPKPGYEIFNSQGFRGPEMTPQPTTGVLRIVAIGDSNTLGWAGEDGAHWPGAFADLLESVGVPSEVVNAGVWGYSSFQGERRMREVLEYRPDLVLISFGSNDAHQVRRPDREFSASSQVWRTAERWVAHYRLGQLLVGAWHRVARGGSEELEPRVALEQYRDHLRAIAEAGRSAGAQVVFLTRPFIGEFDNPLRWKNLAPRYNLATVEVGIEEGLPVVDFYSHFKGRADLFADESHFTVEGHELAARLLLQELRPYLSGKRRELK